MNSEALAHGTRHELVDQEHLSLQRLCVRRRGEWVRNGASLAVLFLESGQATAACGPVRMPLAPGARETVLQRLTLQFEHLVPLLAAEEIALLPEVTHQLKGLRRHAAASPVAQECFRLLSQVPTSPGLERRGQLLHLATLLLTEEFWAARVGRTVRVRPSRRTLERLQALSSQELLTLSVEALAGRFGCSPRHLNRLFQRHFGASVGSLRMEARLLKAASLLRDPHAKVSNVAVQCGFGHPSLFNTCFKRRFGACPSEWRRRGTLVLGRSKPRSPRNSEPGGA